MLRGVRPDDVSHFSHYSYGVRPDRPEHIHTNRSDDLYPVLDDSQAQSIVRCVRQDDFSHYSYGVRPHSIHTNYANCPARAELNQSFHQAGLTGTRRQADGRSTVCWDELSVPVPRQGELIRMPLDQTPELFTLDESAYHTARRTSSCPREPPTSNSRPSCRHGRRKRPPRPKLLS